METDLGTAKQYIDWLVYRPDLSKHGLWGEKVLELDSKKNGGYWNWHVALRKSHTLSKLLFSCAVFLRCTKVVSSDAGCAVVVFEGIITTMEDDCALLLRCCAPLLLLCHGGATGRAPIARDCTASWCPSWRWQRLGIVGIVFNSNVLKLKTCQDFSEISEDVWISSIKPSMFRWKISG